jgi:hypothetical protein
MSARLRMMQRKSIHDPKHSREDDLRMTKAPIPRARQPYHDPPAPLPATQIVTRPYAETSPHRQKIASHNAKQSPTKQLVVRLPISPLKRKVEEILEVPRLTRSQARKNNELLKHKVTQPEHKSQEIISSVETQIANEPAAKRRKPNTAQPSPQPRANAKVTVKSPAKARLGATDLVRDSPRKSAKTTSPRKTAATTSPRKTAVTKKRSEATVQPDKLQTQALGSPRKKPAAKSTIPAKSAKSTKQDSRSTAVPKVAPSSSSSVSPAKTAKVLESFTSPKKSVLNPTREETATSTSMGPSSSRGGPVRSSRASRRPPCIISDFGSSDILI